MTQKTEPGSSRGTEASHPLVWEGEYESNDPVPVRIIELSPDDLLVQCQTSLDGKWDTADDDGLIMDALHSALVETRKRTTT